MRISLKSALGILVLGAVLTACGGGGGGGGTDPSDSTPTYTPLPVSAPTATPIPVSGLQCQTGTVACVVIESAFVVNTSSRCDLVLRMRNTISKSVNLDNLSLTYQGLDRFGDLITFVTPGGLLDMPRTLDANATTTFTIPWLKGYVPLFDCSAIASCPLFAFAPTC